jgi:uncharacterized protein (TIGR02757 family)
MLPHSPRSHPLYSAWFSNARAAAYRFPSRPHLAGTKRQGESGISFRHISPTLPVVSVATLSALQTYLDRLVDRYEKPAFIEGDPISIPHAFDDPRDQEVIGLYAALLAWGRRDVMLRKLEELCERMDHAPDRFVRSFTPETDAAALEDFVHRTFQPVDALWLTKNLSQALDHYGTVEHIFAAHRPETSDDPSPVASMLQGVSTTLLTIDEDTPQRLRKHLARPAAGSACKRLNMYLRWMVRPEPVDFGIWDCLDPAELMLPVDVHVGRQARALGLLNRKTNDWKAVRRLTAICRSFCPDDPARYDFAFFGVGSQDESLDTRFTGDNSVDGSSLPTPR